MARPTILPQFPAGLGGGVGHHIYMHSLAFLRILQTLNVIATTVNIIGHIGDTPLLRKQTNKTLSPLHKKRSNRTREQNQNSNFVCNKNSQNVSL